MDLNGKLRALDTEVKPRAEVFAVVKTLPSNEVQLQINKVCYSNMHYDDLFKAIGKLCTGGIDHDTLINNENFFQQYISTVSDSIENKTVVGVIEEHRKAYSKQVGSHPMTSLPADCFSDEVYENLPEQLRAICLLVENRRKKDVLLIGLLTALSAAVSRYRFHHGSDSDVKEYSAHLLSLVLGPAGSGKGLTRYGNILVEAIARKALKMREDAMKNYKMARGEYERERKKREKEGVSLNDLQEPERPIKYGFAMSASDTTQAALVEILSNNPIGGFAYDSEVDTMVQGNAKKDFGGFSDVVRKVFHHEPLARQRKGDGESYIVPTPRLAVMLSGTHDQLKKLITSEYNGLFSRLWYYSIPAVFTEYSIAKQQTDIVGEACMRLQNEVLEKADLWSDELIYLEFSQSQEQELLVEMSDKKMIEEKHGGDVGASWLRMALITKRIAVTLAGFQGTTEGKVPDNCWRVALALLPALKAHCLRALDVVRSNQGKIDISKEAYYAMKKGGMTDEEIAKELKVSTKTLQRRKVDWT